MNGPKNLECSIRLDWKGLQGQILQLIGLVCKLQRKKRRPYSQHLIFFVTLYLTNGPDKLERNIKLGWKGLLGTITLDY